MPALDRFHNAVRNALIKDGWTVTADPLHLDYEENDLLVDLAAERVLAAEKGLQKIAVEIKMFSGTSKMRDLHNAVGQFVVYRTVLSKLEPERELYLAVPEVVRVEVFERGIGKLTLAQDIRRAFSFDPYEERIVQWIL